MRAIARTSGSFARREGVGLFAYWRTLTHLTTLTAFAALFLTGELNPAVSAVFFALWLFSFVRRRPLGFWRPWMSNTLTLLVILMLARNMRGNFFESLLTLLLYLVIAKNLTLKTPRDYLQAQILAFFVILSTAVITVSFYLLFFLVVYLGLATLGFILYSLTRPEDRVYQKSGRGVQEYAERLPRRISATGLRTAAVLGLLTVFYFIMIPHVSVQRVDAPFASRRASEEAMSGFSEEMEFGEFKSLQPDSRVVLRIEPYWHEGQIEHRPDHLYLRGTPLEYYNEERWTRANQRGTAHIEDQPRFNIPEYSLQRGRNMILRVHQNPDFTRRIFLAPLTSSVDFGQERQIRMEWATASFFIPSFGDRTENTYTNPLSYTLTCNLVEEVTPLLPNLIAAQKANRPAYSRWMRDHPPLDSSRHDELPALNAAELDALQTAASAQGSLSPDPAAEDAVLRLDDAPTSVTLHDTMGQDAKEIEDERLRLRMYSLLGSPGEVSWLLQRKIPVLTDQDREINLQLPPTRMTARIAELAAREAPGPTEAEMVFQLVNFLRREFAYTLEPETPSGMHPIEAFLFETRQGHCEYFATSLVLMLRSRGVPARLINGFYTTEWNALGDIYIAKQSDAHAWAEVWLDGPGWLTVDPTPPDSAGRAAYGFAEPTVPEIISEYLRIQWQRYVIDYSSSRQFKLFDSMRNLPGLHLLFEVRDRWNREMMEKELNSQSDSGADLTALQRRRNLLYFLDGLALVAMVIAMRWTWKTWRNRRARLNGYTGLDYVDALMRRAGKFGLRRSPQQTVSEFMASLVSLGWAAEDVNWLVALYHRHRFGGDAPDAAERHRARNLARNPSIPAGR